jgi:predicted dehydrogenase
VLGAGNYASAVLLPALKKTPGVELVGVASASGMSAAHAARKFGFQYASSGEDKILADERVNSVAVLTRHHQHAAQVLEALRRGKHVFCEKPLALTYQELDEIEQAARQPSAPLLMVGFNRRFSPFALQLFDFFKDRREPLAAHYRVNAGYIPPNHWVHDPQQGGGRWVGEGCHFVDFLTCLVGEPPVEVSAVGLPDLGRYREDNLVVQYTFRDGSTGTVAYLANGDKSFAKERVEVFGGGRAAALDDFRTLELVRDGKRTLTRSRLRQDKGHAAGCLAFAGAVAAGGPAPIPYEQLFGVHRLTLAGLEALRSGARVKAARH